MDAWYDIAQVCLNGHLITDSANSFPQHRKPFCPKCGKETTTTCGDCGADIQGDYHVPGVISAHGMQNPPAYCHACGEPHPWTKIAITAAKELAHTMGLDEDEAEALANSIDDLVAEGPRTSLAVQRFRKVSKAAGKETYDLFKGVLGGVISVAVQKQLFGP